jgi:catechol 2,3-dioxygenase-like lactoylglutathione lyase family enzyme
VLDRLDHVVIAVNDLDAAAATYGRLLGREPSWAGRHPEMGTANRLFRLDDVYVELLAPEGTLGPYRNYRQGHVGCETPYSIIPIRPQRPL